MPSQRLTDLQARIQELRECLLPNPFLLPGEYEDEKPIHIKTVSFRVLAHAEIETYFEDRVVEIAKVAIRSWEDDRHVSRPVLYLLAFSGHSMKRPPDFLKAPSENRKKDWPELVRVDHRLSWASSEFVRMITRENHGVREKNILSMLLPIGFEPDSIDEVFLTDIEDFGKRRGEAAHSSALAQVQQALDPEDEHKRIKC